MVLFELFCPNEVGEIYACVHCRLLANTTELIRVEKAIGWQIELKSIADNFFDEFASDIE